MDLIQTIEEEDNPEDLSEDSASDDEVLSILYRFRIIVIRPWSMNYTLKLQLISVWTVPANEEAS